MLWIPSAPTTSVVVTRRAVAELDLHRSVALGDAVERQTHPDRRVTGSLAYGVVQCRAGERATRSDAGPETVDGDVSEQPPTVIEEALAPDLHRALGDIGIEAEGAQGASGVAGQVDAGARGREGRLALDHLRREAGASERPRRGESRDPGTDDQDARARHLVAIPMLIGAVRIAEPEPPARSRTKPSSAS